MPNPHAYWATQLPKLCVHASSQLGTAPWLTQWIVLGLRRCANDPIFNSIQHLTTCTKTGLVAGKI
jgi:hypothetical protein